MSKRNPMRASQVPKAGAVAGKDVRVAVGHTLVVGTTAAGKTVYDLLRVKEEESRLIRKKPADGQSDAGDEAWA